MKEERLFEASLLEQSFEDKKNFFKNYIVSHPKMKVALESLKNEILYGSQNIIMVVGPSGVGKSRLFKATIISFLKDFEKEMEEDKGMIPITGIELPNPDLGKFNWKDFYYRVLQSLNEPLIDYKKNVERFSDDKKFRSTETAPALRRSIENAFEYRKTKALLIDEAQHFFTIHSNSRGKSEQNQRQFNSIKSLANMSNTKIVLFGTYDLNAVFNLDGQLSRRVKEIHFPRYNISNKEDGEIFRSMLYTFQKLIPLAKEPDLLKHQEYLYEYSIGCIGILKEWLLRCTLDAMKNNEETITLGNLQNNALQLSKLLTLANEVIEGELYFAETNTDRKN